MKMAAILAAVFFATSASVTSAWASPGKRHALIAPHGLYPRPLLHHSLPWVEGVTPPLENRLFDATYRVLPSHNVLKVYVFDAGGYESAGIRFSARVPHTSRDLSAAELDREAAQLIRTTFASFPDVQTLDVWATIPVNESQETKIESTVFSVSADRAAFEAMSAGRGMSDSAFLDAFGRIWVAPEVPQQ